MYMSLGVAVPLYNSSFRYGADFYGEVATTISKNDTSCTLTNISLSEFENLVGDNDMILLGPSTHTLNPGATEEIKIDGNISKSGSNYTLNTSDAINYYYKPTDSISGVSSYFPQGWSFTRNSATVTKYKLCRLLDSDIGSNYETGIAGDDFYCLKIKYSGTSTSSQSIYQILDTDLLLPSTYYRIGGTYKIKWDAGIGASLFALTLYDSTAGAVINQNYLFNYSASQPITWTLFNSSVGQSISNPSACKVYFTHNTPSGISGCTLYLDAVYVEHAKDTDGDSSAVYTFTEMPLFGSESWQFEDFQKKLEAKDGGLRFFNTTGRMTERAVFSCSFENVSQSFFENLNTLRQWQLEGENLVLHTTENATSILPSILIGKMELNKIRQGSYDKTKKSFDFIFRESI